MRILIVEDEYLIAADTALVLEQAGCDVVGIAGSVRKALDIIEDGGCDAIVLDANLHGESAEPVALAARERNLPFLVLSGYARSQRSGLLGEAPFLTKPFQEADLVAAIRALEN
jgi:DNA-binding response OmpR family regulator